MRIHHKIKAHLSRKHKYHMENTAPNLQTDNSTSNPVLKKIKQPVFFIPLIILIIALSVAGLIYFQTQSKIVNLASGKIVNLDDNLGPYVEQSSAICDQNNLASKAFKSFTTAMQPTESGIAPKYGETTWNYILQGEISQIQNDKNGTKFTLINGEEKLIALANNTLTWSKPNIATTSSNLVPVKVDSSTFHPNDKVYLYYLVKCGGKRKPLMFLEYIQKASITKKSAPTTSTTQNKTASFSAGLRTEANGLSGFKGNVKEKGANYLILEGGSQTIKLEIDNNIHLRVIDESELMQNPELYVKKPAQETSISAVKIGEAVDATGVIIDTVFKAMSVIIIR